MKNNINTDNINNFPVYLFQQGKNFESYNFLGVL